MTPTPEAQVVGLLNPIDELVTIAAKKVNSDMFMKPIQWHIFDESYNRKPGKYQREVLA